MPHSLEPFESPGNLHEDVGMFEAAVHAPPAELPPVILKSVLIALDGSNQDAAARALGRHLGERFRSQVTERSGLQSSAAIRTAVASLEDCGLLVLPVPFGRDLSELGDESLGEIADSLLAHPEVPILAVRQPWDAADLTASMQRIVLPLGSHEPRSILALAWAIQLLNNGGKLRVLLFPGAADFAQAQALLEQHERDRTTAHAALERVMQTHFSSLVAAAQRCATEQGIDAQVKFVTERPLDQTLDRANAKPSLLLTASSVEPATLARHRTTDLLLRSKGPVLVV